MTEQNIGSATDPTQDYASNRHPISGLSAPAVLDLPASDLASDECSDSNKCFLLPAITSIYYNSG